MPQPPLSTTRRRLLLSTLTTYQKIVLTPSQNLDSDMYPRNSLSRSRPSDVSQRLFQTRRNLLSRRRRTSATCRRDPLATRSFGHRMTPAPMAPRAVPLRPVHQLAPSFSFRHGPSEKAPEHPHSPILLELRFFCTKEALD